MNEKTLISCHGYSGDQEQIRTLLPYLTHHKCPLVIFSPEDSPIKVMGPHICRWQGMGRRAYTGQASLDRQIAQMRALLDYDFGWFLMNDSDSICITPQIPPYLYERPGTLWSNIVSDEMHSRPPGYPWPRLASQPPYFCSRDVLERLIRIGPKIRAEQSRKADGGFSDFIDWAMLMWCVAGNIHYMNFRDGISCPSSTPESLNTMAHYVSSEGRVFLHSIKTRRALNHIAAARQQYNRTTGRGNRL
jgi:hypothetical protein